MLHFFKFGYETKSTFYSTQKRGEFLHLHQVPSKRGTITVTGVSTFKPRPTWSLSSLSRARTATRLRRLGRADPGLGPRLTLRLARPGPGEGSQRNGSLAPTQHDKIGSGRARLRLVAV